MRFGRRRESPDEGPYANLRAQALSLDPAAAGLEPSERFPDLFGVVMETGFPNGTATLVALTDGTTSLYLSSGGGMIGGGNHEAIRTATFALLEIAHAELAGFEPTARSAVPGDGRVVLHALAYDGPRSVEAVEDELGERRHPLWPVFHASHDVITQLRLLDGSA